LQLAVAIAVLLQISAIRCKAICQNRKLPYINGMMAFYSKALNG
jgi:hypothetical protein